MGHKTYVRCVLFGSANSFASTTALARSIESACEISPYLSALESLGIVSLGAHSQVAAAASCLCFSPGYDGAHMVHHSLGRLNLLDILLRHNALIGGHPGPRKKSEKPHLLLVDATIEGASPSHARQE